MNLKDIPLENATVIPAKNEPIIDTGINHDSSILWNEKNFIRAEFVNEERSTVRLFYLDDEKEQEFDIDINSRTQDGKEHPYVTRLFELTTLDDMHENTYKRIKYEEKMFKEYAIRMGKEQGLLIDPVAYYDTETQSTKVDTKFYSYGLKLLFEDFNADEQKEDLFILKLAAFEMDLVKDCQDKEMKSRLRKAKNPIEILHVLLEIKGS